jgi:nucleoside 2-deoxyribosyltransferase
MIYYLAGPIDLVSKEEDKNWKDELKDVCKGIRHNIVFFDPTTYFFTKLDDATSTYIHDVNMYAIDEADALICRWMTGKISVGTPMELYYAIQRRKHIILITDMADQSVYINYVSNRGTVVPDINSAYRAICEFEENPTIKEQKRLIKDLARTSHLAFPSELLKKAETEECVKG